MPTNWGVRLRVEPDVALSFLRDQFTQSVAGSGRVVLISGGLASGKTQVQSELLHAAAESDAITLGATGAPDEEKLENGIIEQLLTSSTLPAEIAGRLRRILDPADDGPPGQGLPDTREGQSETPAAREICRVLLGVARERPVVIAVDDLQFADESSVRLLLQLQRRIRSTRLLMVLTHWDRSHTAHPQPGARFARQPHYHVQLAPMSERAIGDLVSESLDHPAVGELPSRMRELTAGNPMLVHALIDDYRGGEGTGKVDAGRAFSQAVRAFLHRWDAPLREVAGALAVLGAHGMGELVGRLVEIESDVVEEVVDILTNAGLLAQGRFRHPNAEAAALDSLSPALRARLHVRAAELKHQRAATVAEVAAHLVAAGEISGEWSIPVLREAAEQAALTDDVRFATRCLELAGSLCADPDERRSIQRSLARITWRINPSAASSHLASLRQSALEGTLDHGDSVAVMRHSLWNGDRETFTKAFDVLTGAPDALDSRSEAEMRLAHQWYFGPAPGGEEVAGTHPGSDPWNHTASTLAQVWTHGVGDATTACAERILQNCRLGDTTLEALSTAIIALAHHDRTEQAERWCTSLSDEAKRRGAVTWQAMLDSVWAGVVLRRGEVSNAADRARAALRLLGAQSWGVSISLPLTTLLLAETAAGAFDEAAKTLRHPVPHAMFRTVGGLRYLRARGHYYLATNRVLAAVSDFHEVQRLMSKMDVDLPALVPWRTDLAEANLRLGNPTTARELAKQQLDRAGEDDAYSRGSSLRVLAFVSEPTERPALLGQAVRYFKESGDRLELTRTLRAVNQIQKRRGDLAPVKGIRMLPDKKPAAAVLPNGATARAVVATAHVAVSEPADSAVLSEAELRVAQLAALGRTNRQIGSSLFITVSTVEQHLTRVYRKLGVRGRSDLPAELATAT
jgi:DNA-binding CsgD family transcriptional regulator